MHIKFKGFSRSQIWVFTMAAMVALAISIGSLLPKGSIPPYQDFAATVHMAAYALLGFLAQIAMRATASRAMAIIGGVTLFGLVLELVQIWLPSRQSLIQDAVANGAGVVLGVSLALAFHRWHFRP